MRRKLMICQESRQCYNKLITRLRHERKHWMHALRIPLGQCRVGSHRHRVEIDHHLPCLQRICHLCHLQEMESKDHPIFSIFRCPVYYEIQGRFYFLYWGLDGSLSTFFRVLDHRSLSLFTREVLGFTSQALCGPLCQFLLGR